MNDSTIVILFSIALSGVLLWLLTSRHKSTRTAATSFHPKAMNAFPTAKHYVYFPQIRQALSTTDFQYLMENAPSKVAKQAIRERRSVARRFLKGLHEDFSNLARLGRIIAALSPEVSREQETERLILNLKFQMLYALVWLRLSTGNLPLPQLEHLTELVGGLASRMDEAMAKISALSAGQVPGGFSA
jgi:endo-1,4-beta-mannosidase